MCITFYISLQRQHRIRFANFLIAFGPQIRLQLLRHTPLDPPPERLVMIQVVVVVLACILAFLCALTLAGISLSAFGKLLRRADDARNEPRL